MKYAFSQYYNQSTCSSIRDLDDIKLNYKNQVIDFRVLAHGKEDKSGAVVCKKTVETDEILDKVDGLVATGNKVFLSLDSCYSAEVLKKFVLRQEKEDLDAPSLDHACVYSASAFNTLANTDEDSFARFQFLDLKKIVGKNLISAYTQTTGGLLSGFPWETADLVNAFLNKTVDLKRLLFFINLAIESGNLSTEKKVSLHLVKTLRVDEFVNISEDLNTLGDPHSQKYTSWNQNQRNMTDYIDSYERIANLEIGLSFLEALRNESLYSREYLSVCKQKDPRRADGKLLNETEKFCTLNHVNSLHTGYLSALYRLRHFLVSNGYEKEDPKKLFPQSKTLEGITQLIDSSITQKVPRPVLFDHHSLSSILGEKEGMRFSWDGKNELTLASIFGTISRGTVQSLDSHKLKSLRDKKRYSACKNFVYSKEGKLTWVGN